MPALDFLVLVFQAVEPVLQPLAFGINSQHDSTLGETERRGGWAPACKTHQDTLGHTRGTPGHAGHPTPKEELGSERGSRDRGQCRLAKISGTRPALPDAPLTYEVIRFPDVVVPHGDFQGLFGQVAMLYLIAELLWGEQEPSG